MERFPWRFAVYLAAGLYLFADMAVWRGPLYRRLTRPWAASGEGGAGEQAAVVYGRPVTRLELAEALRAYLWQRGETWQALGAEARERVRQLVLEQLVNDRLVRAFRVMNRLDQPVPEAPVEREVELLRRQFPREGEWAQRLALQARSEEAWRAETREALEDAAWIEEKIRHRLVEITEDLTREWYDQRGAELEVPERFQAAHLFLSAHDPQKPERSAEVAAVTARLAAGETFEKLVAELSEDARTKLRRGELGWFSAERMPADFMAAVRAAPLGDVQGPVKTSLGWHWLRVTAREPARQPAYEEVREEIRARLEDERRALAVKALMAELRLRSVQPTRFLHYHPEVIQSVEPAPLAAQEGALEAAR